MFWLAWLRFPMNPSARSRSQTYNILWFSLCVKAAGVFQVKKASKQEVKSMDSLAKTFPFPQPKYNDF